MSESNLLLALPEELRAGVARAAAAEHTTPQAWVERAVVRQLGERQWSELLDYGAARAQALGYTEDDVERLVEETRSGR